MEEIGMIKDNMEIPICYSKRYDCIVLDLDGSLVYSSDRDKGKGKKILFNNVYGEKEEIWVHFRPGFYEFLTMCFEHSTVGVWSMGQPGYVEAIVSLFPNKPAFVYNWCNCDRERGKIYKKLENIPYNGSIVMIDDSRDILQETNRVETIIISKWKPCLKMDTTLYDLIPLLFILAT